MKKNIFFVCLIFSFVCFAKAPYFNLDAENVFVLDEKRIEKYDSSHSTDTEDRWNVIGMVDDVLFVVYTERNDRTRIISARKATKEETDEYYDDYDLR